MHTLIKKSTEHKETNGYQISKRLVSMSENLHFLAPFVPVPFQSTYHSPKSDSRATLLSVSIARSILHRRSVIISSPLVYKAILRWYASKKETSAKDSPRTMAIVALKCGKKCAHCTARTKSLRFIHGE